MGDALVMPFCHQKKTTLGKKDTTKATPKTLQRCGRDRYRCALFEQNATLRIPAHQLGLRRELHLALVPGEAVVEVLSLGSLRPLLVGWLLPATIASGTLRSAVSHGLRSVTGRGLSGWATVVAVLTLVLT